MASDRFSLSTASGGLGEFFATSGLGRVRVSCETGVTSDTPCCLKKGKAFGKEQTVATMSLKRDHQGFEIEVPTFVSKVTHQDCHSRTSSLFFNTNDESVFRGELTCLFPWLSS